MGHMHVCMCLQGGLEAPRFANKHLGPNCWNLIRYKFLLTILRRGDMVIFLKDGNRLEIVGELVLAKSKCTERE